MCGTSSDLEFGGSASVCIICKYFVGALLYRNCGWKSASILQQLPVGILARCLRLWLQAADGWDIVPPKYLDPAVATHQPGFW